MNRRLMAFVLTLLLLPRLGKSADQVNSIEHEAISGNNLKLIVKTETVHDKRSLIDAFFGGQHDFELVGQSFSSIDYSLLSQGSALQTSKSKCIIRLKGDGFMDVLPLSPDKFIFVQTKSTNTILELRLIDSSGNSVKRIDLPVSDSFNGTRCPFVLSRDNRMMLVDNGVELLGVRTEEMEIVKINPKVNEYLQKSPNTEKGKFFLTDDWSFLVKVSAKDGHCATIYDLIQGTATNIAQPLGFIFDVESYRTNLLFLECGKDALLIVDKENNLVGKQPLEQTFGYPSNHYWEYKQGRIFLFPTAFLLEKSDFQDGIIEWDYKQNTLKKIFLDFEDAKKFLKKAK